MTARGGRRKTPSSTLHRGSYRTLRVDVVVVAERHMVGQVHGADYDRGNTMKRKLAGLLVGAAIVGGSVAYALPAHADQTTVTITCTNGFTKTVNAKASGGIIKALNNFNAYSQTGVTCSAA
jgi:hypothetical protein